MTCNCSNIQPLHQMECGHKINNLKLKFWFPKHLTKPMKLLFKQYNILDIEMYDDSNFCDSKMSGRLITRSDKYVIIRYSDNENRTFEWRISEDEYINS